MAVDVGSECRQSSVGVTAGMFLSVVILTMSAAVNVQYRIISRLGHLLQPVYV